MWALGWGGWEYDIIFGKISTKSDSLQWVTNVNTNNEKAAPVWDASDSSWKREWIYNWDHMYSVTVSPYGGLVLVVAQTYFVHWVFDNNPNSASGESRIIIYGINGVTGDVQFNRHVDLEGESAKGF